MIPDQAVASSPTRATPKKRPKISAGMRRRAASQIVAKMIRAGIFEECDRNECVAEIVQATRLYKTDGYRIARALERSALWDCDLFMAETLHGFWPIVETILAEREKRWAVENPQEPTFRDGDTVIWRGSPATVHGVSAFRPQCYRVRQGEMKANHCYIVPFEDVSAVPAGCKP